MPKLISIKSYLFVRPDEVTSRDVIQTEKVKVSWSSYKCATGQPPSEDQTVLVLRTLWCEEDPISYEEFKAAYDRDKT